MTIFAILADKPNPTLRDRIKELFPTDFYELSDAEWLIAARTTANPLAEQLDVRSGNFGRVLVIETRGTGAGWHGTAMWEWLRTKLASDD